MDYVGRVTRNELAIAVLVSAMLAACSYATVVHREEYSGVIELNGDLDDAMKKAKGEMAGHCGADNFTVVSEGYEPSGRSSRVWRVRYQCNNAPAGYQPQGPYQGPPQYPGQPPYPQQPPNPDQGRYPQQPQYPDQGQYPQQPQYPDQGQYPQQPQYPPPQQQYPQR